MAETRSVDTVRSHIPKCREKIFLHKKEGKEEYSGLPGLPINPGSSLSLYTHSPTRFSFCKSWFKLSLYY